MKPVQFNIPKTQGTSFHVQKDEAQDFYGRLHQHPEWQITAIHKGEGILFAGNSSTSFQVGDVFMLGSNTPHLLKNSRSTQSEIDTGVCSVSIFFGKDSFGKEFFSLPELRQLDDYLKEAKRGIMFKGKEKEVLFESLSSFMQKQGFDLLIDLLSMLKLMMNYLEQEFINSQYYDAELESRTDERMQKVMQYSIQHLDREIKLEEVAKEANLSVSQFCRYFKLHTRKTYIQYLNELRIEHACSLLRREDLSIAQISFESGFQNLSHFNRQFLKIKEMTPSAYRRQGHTF